MSYVCVTPTEVKRLLAGVFPGAETDLEEAAEVIQGALGPQETPGENGADLLTHGVEMGDEAVRYLRHRAQVRY